MAKLICFYCDGSGQGLYDGLRCPECHGIGSIDSNEDESHYYVDDYYDE